MGAVILRFANCELDLARIVLRRDGAEVKLEPRAFDVLAYLVQRRGSVVRKQELLDEIWGDRFVSESALTTRIKAVRQAVDDDEPCSGKRFSKFERDGAQFAFAPDDRSGRRAPACHRRDANAGQRAGFSVSSTLPELHGRAVQHARPSPSTSE